MTNKELLKEIRKLKKENSALKEKQIKNFRTLFPMYKDYKIYGALAGFTINDKIIKKAKDDGFFVLQKKGDILVETHNEIKSY